MALDVTMPDIFTQEASIITAAADRLVRWGQTSAERVLAGKFPDNQDVKAAKILLYLEVYRSKVSLTVKQQEAILYVLFELSELNIQPTIDLIAGLEAIRFYESYYESAYE